MSTFADLQVALSLPIVQAPMAGGHTPPALVAAVSNAGALGSIGAGYLGADQIREVGQAVRQQTDRPFALNLFIPTESLPPDPALVQAWLDRLAPYHDQFDLPAPALPSQVAEPFDEQWAAVMDVRPAAFSFTFGRLPCELAREAQRRGILVAWQYAKQKGDPKAAFDVDYYSVIYMSSQTYSLKCGRNSAYSVSGKWLQNFILAVNSQGPRTADVGDGENPPGQRRRLCSAFPK